MKKQTRMYILLIVGAMLISYALGEYFFQIGLVRRWQAEGLAAWNAWQVDEWQDWWVANAWEHAYYCWEAVGSNVVSAISGVASLATSSVKLWKWRQARAEAR